MAYRKYELYSQKEDAYLRKYHGKLSYEVMARKLGRSYEGVKGRCGLLGLRRPNGCMVVLDRDEAYMRRVSEELR